MGSAVCPACVPLMLNSLVKILCLLLGVSDIKKHLGMLDLERKITVLAFCHVQYE